MKQVNQFHQTIEFKMDCALESVEGNHKDPQIYSLLLGC